MFKKKITIALTLFITTLLGGTLGYTILAKASFLDALYMTVITISTVGYKEVIVPSSEVKIFSIFLIFFSLFNFTYSASILSQYIIDSHSYINLKKKKMKKKMKNLSKHIIICGYGNNGIQAAKVFDKQKLEYVVIEEDESKIKTTDNFLHIIGNAEEDNILIQANISSANCLITTIPNDAGNLFICLSAKELNPNITIISRVVKESSQYKLLKAGADHVIMPDKIAGIHMASLYTQPELTHFLNDVTFEHGHINVKEIPYDKIIMKHEKSDSTLRDLEITEKFECNIIGYKLENKNYVVNPKDSTNLEKNSKIIIIGTNEQVSKAAKYYGIK